MSINLETKKGTFIPYGRQWLDDEDVREVVKVLRGDWITQGPAVRRFEEMLAHLVESKYAVAFSSGTAALHAACFAAGIKPGDEVITTPISFVATGNCILYLGGKPIFVDVTEDTVNIDPEKIEEKITPRTKAIIPVDFAGHPAELERIYRIAIKNNLLVIEDACHALGAEYRSSDNSGLKGKDRWVKVGSCTHSHMSVFSFHPVKSITTGEGGAVTTNDSYFYRKLILFRNHGITKDPSSFSGKNKDPWFYEMQELGYNYRITDFQCALGMSQFRKLFLFIRRRRKIARIYHQAFKDLKEISIPSEKPYVRSAWHLYVIRISPGKDRRKKVFEALRKEKMGVQVHYIPIYYHPYYQRLGYRKGICPVAERYYERALTLPLFPKMRDEEVFQVIAKVRRVIREVENG